MSERRTNKKKLIKGVKFLALALPLAFLGPSVIYMAFGNREESYYIPLLAFGFITAIGSVFCMFKGIQTIMRGIYDD